MQTNVEHDNDTPAVMTGHTISVLSHDISTPPKPPPPVLPQKPCLKQKPRKSFDLGIIEDNNKQMNLTEMGHESISSSVSAFGHFLSISILSQHSFMRFFCILYCINIIVVVNREELILFIAVNCNEIYYPL